MQGEADMTAQGEEKPVTGLSHKRQVPGRRRVTTAAVVAAVAAALVAGCGTVPGAAAVIDDMDISTQEIYQRTAEVEDLYASLPDDAARADLARAQLTGVIRHQLVQRAAHAAGITVSTADINGYISAQNQVQQAYGMPLLDAVFRVSDRQLPDTIYDYLALQQLAQHIPDDGQPVYDVELGADALIVATEADAQAARDRFRADPTAFQDDPAADPRNLNLTWSFIRDAPVVALPILTASAGDAVVLNTGDQGYVVVGITSREVVPSTLTRADLMAINQSNDPAADLAVMSLLLGLTADDTSITVNPRFGTFDPRLVQLTD